MNAASGPRGVATGPLPLDLGDGLVLRTATVADTEALVAFNGDVHREPGAAEPNASIAVWTRDLLERPHPTFRPNLFTVVVETATGAIVSSLNLIPQTWAYGGIPFDVGRIELVGTRPDYRRRGLVRLQMEVAHRWSAELGHLAQVITGIPGYYRQFGYEYALTLGGSRAVARWRVPALAEGEAEPFGIRPATPADIPFITSVDAHGRQRSLVSCMRDEPLWRHELDGRSDGDRLAVVERGDRGDDATYQLGEPVGFVVYAPQLWGPSLEVLVYELAAGVSWLAATPSVLRFLARAGEHDVPTSPDELRFEQVAFHLGVDHPVYRALPDRAKPGSPPYAWYIRVPNLPAFESRIAPVLDARLAASDAAGHTGDLRLNFYRDGLRLSFTAGRLTAAEPWRPTDEPAVPGADASFPALTFLQLLFGYRSLSDLQYSFPDCEIRSEQARVLLTALFPTRPSQVWPVG